MERATDILKIRYAISTFGVDAMCSHSRYVHELFPNGKVTYGHYEKGTRKAIEKDKTRRATAEDFTKLCAELNACIESADRQQMYMDDTGAEVKLYRPFGRVNTMDHGCGNAGTDVGRIITKNYIFGRAGMRWRRLRNRIIISVLPIGTYHFVSLSQKSGL